VSGVVQGVGFRPFVYRLAAEEGLAGSIGNDTDGVAIEVEGLRDRVEVFLLRLRAEKPPLARIDGEDRVQDYCERSQGPGEYRNSGRCGDMYGLFKRVAGSLRSKARVSILELHPLRAAVHDYAADSLRSAADFDGAIHYVSSVPGGIRRSSESTVSRAAECLLDVRAAPVAGRS